ncbi:hypothetical protein PVL30_004788 [Lodderomyces elongisporus]|uniref:uncharacterized protein n=1 Tax=Lodderomyces elongisporus TaxID=36914 RepID=UPI0029211B70|nr:uncharacterized protein PVL30_004788 [Lodderomyces elongisporus]WLF80994.1 hypothetical protein PVL30_004788 [Lodderomyces elongisporus]
MPSATTEDNRQTQHDSWFDPLPLDEYLEINKLSRKTVPKERPVDSTDKLGELDIRCGPILRLAGTLENGSKNYRGSIMLVLKDLPETHTPQITYKIGPAAAAAAAEEEAAEEEAAEEQNGSATRGPVSATKFSTGEFPATKYYEEDGFSFYRFNVELELVEYEQKVEYYIDNFFKKSFQFYIPSYEESMNVISYSCNGFSLACDCDEYKSSLWLDVLNKHAKQHYHVMLGGGDQIYCDAIKLHSQKLTEWLETSNPVKKRSAPADSETIKEFSKFYLKHYMDWFGKGFWTGKNSRVLEALFPLAMSQIPSVNIYDDHDIIDGFGSYHDSTMAAPIFSKVGNIAYRYYMLFQHQMNPDEELHSKDPSWVLSKRDGPFIKQKNHSVYMRLGKEISLLGVDCRTQRKLKQINEPETYKIIFDRLKKELSDETNKGETKHLLVMLGVPILYPRLVWLETLMSSPVFAPLRKLAQKGVINKGLVNEFDGEIEVLDDLNDHWCTKNHKRERNKLLKDLTEFGAKRGVRITILSGDVHLGCIGRLKSKYHHHPHAHLLGDPQEIQRFNEKLIKYPEHDPRLIFNVVSSAIVNAPPPDAMATLLNKRSKIHHFNRDTDEDVLRIFVKDTDGKPRDNKQFLNKRNWSDLILAKQSVLYKSRAKLEGDEVDNADEIEAVYRKFPQPVFDGHESEDLLKDQKPNDREIEYPLFASSLVTTLRVEQDKSDVKSKSVGYEVFIPRLIGHYELDNAPIKHVDV